MKNLLRAAVIGVVSVLLFLIAVPATLGMSSESALAIYGAAVFAATLIVLWATE
jgi:hypothetical protein